jgi:hypothetical protein
VKWLKVMTGVRPCWRQAVGDAAVVREFRGRELALGRLDPRPFQREPIGIEAQLRQHGDVVFVAVIVVAGVA